MWGLLLVQHGTLIGCCINQITMMESSIGDSPSEIWFVWCTETVLSRRWILRWHLRQGEVERGDGEPAENLADPNLFFDVKLLCFFFVARYQFCGILTTHTTNLYTLLQAHFLMSCSTYTEEWCKLLYRAAAHIPSFQDNDPDRQNYYVMIYMYVWSRDIYYYSSMLHCFIVDNSLPRPKTSFHSCMRLTRAKVRMGVARFN